MPKSPLSKALWRQRIERSACALLQGTVDGGAVVEAFGELGNLRTHEYIGTADGLFSAGCLPARCTAGATYACPPANTHTGEVDDYPAEGQPWLLWTVMAHAWYGILCKGSQLFLFNLFLFFVVFVADVSATTLV